MDDHALSEEEIKSLFHPTEPPRLPPPASAYPAQQASPEFPTTDSAKAQTPAAPPSPFHRAVVPAAPQPVHVTPAPTTFQTPSQVRYHSKPARLTRAFLGFFLAFFIGFTLINGGTYGARLSFWWKHDFLGQEVPTTPPTIQPTTPGQPGAVPTTPTPTAPGVPSPTTPTAPLPGQPVVTPGVTNRLIIPKIDVDAPVIWNADPGNILKDLQKGIAHYQGTALPNEKNGNVFLTGHSSNYVWDRGQYNRVFANLDKLVAGDLVTVVTDKSQYVYRVKDSVVVKPAQLEVLEQTPNPILSLMTCVPVGTNLRRLVVRADLVRVQAK